jgi:hypothetical protein
MQRHLARICAIANRKQHFKRNIPLGIAEEITVQREDVLGQALQLLEIYGIASTTLEMVADRIDYPWMILSASGRIKRRSFMMLCAISASRLISGAGS